jgi:hypothetical protein
MPTNTPPPPREGKEVSRKGEPPAKTAARGNLSKPEPGKIVALNFRVPAEILDNVIALSPGGRAPAFGGGIA